MRSAFLRIALLAAISGCFLSPIFADAGFSVHSYIPIDSRSIYFYPSAGADFMWRADMTLGIPLRVGVNAGANWFFTKPTNTTQLFFIGIPVTANAAYTFSKEGFIFRAGLGLGPYLSLVNYTRNGITPGITLFAEPFLEIGYAFNGFDLLLIPAYDAIFDFLNPGGTYVQMVSVRLAMMFK